MKDSIKSALSSIIHSEIDFKKCYINSQKSILVKTCKLYNKGYSRDHIQETLHISRYSYYNYLKRGASLGMCNYESKHKCSVVCLTTKEFFSSTAEARSKYNTTHIVDCCKGKRKSSGKHPVTNKPLEWMYLDEYEKSKNGA